MKLFFFKKKKVTVLARGARFVMAFLRTLIEIDLSNVFNKDLIHLLARGTRFTLTFRRMLIERDLSNVLDNDLCSCDSNFSYRFNDRILL